jgi:arsenite oxidase small subunit
MTDPEDNSKLSRRKILEHWWLIPVAGAASFFGWFGLRSYNILLGKSDPGTANFQAGSSVKIAALDQFPKVWAAKEFDYPVKLGSSIGQTPSVLIRTSTLQSGGISIGDQHFLGLSRVCSHQNCVCDFVRDPEIAALAYKYRPDQGQPVLGCACHFSAFDPENAGASVSGPALKNLARVRLEHRSGTIYATGIETL